MGFRLVLMSNRSEASSSLLAPHLRSLPFWLDCQLLFAQMRRFSLHDKILDIDIPWVYGWD
jgi:hypothetical protein